MSVRKVSRDTKPATKGKRGARPRDITDEVVDPETADGDVITDDELSVLPEAPKAKKVRGRRGASAPEAVEEAPKGRTYKALKSFRIGERVVKAGETVTLSEKQARDYIAVGAIELSRAAA